MIDKLTSAIDFQSEALKLRSERQSLLASNIANADTPFYKARDFDFKTALSQATGLQPTVTAPMARTDAAHLPATGALGSGGPSMLYRTPTQSAIDGNSVDMDTERANFAENSVRYEAGLRFINGQIRTMLTAVTGQ